MTDLYACDGCGTVRANSNNCEVCGGAAVEELDVGGEEYVCEVCGDTFPTAQGLAGHKSSHSDGGEE